MELQHVNVKLLVQNPKEVDLEPLIPVFHSWIQDQTNGERLLDVADYRHVEAGPGVVLIGHRLEQAARAALTACQRLEADARLGGKLRFNGREIEIFFNDRLLVPNSDATRDAVARDLQAFSQKLFRGTKYSMSYGSDPRKLFAVSLNAAQPFSLAELLEQLS
jgi:hypothetical protein